MSAPVQSATDIAGREVTFDRIGTKADTKQLAYIVERLGYALSDGGDSLANALVSMPIPAGLKDIGGFDLDDHDSTYRDLLLQTAFRYVGS